jgi:HSP20 family protein
VLTVTIPLAERAKPRKIDVAHGGSQKSITVDSE